MEDKSDTKEMMVEAVIEALNRGSAEKKYIDIGRIPFICDDIRGIHTAINEIKELVNDNFVRKESFDPVKLIAYGLVSLLAAGVGYMLLHPK